MTQLEQQTLVRVKAACQQYIESETTIDWEQRRYEIARDVYANQFHGNLTAKQAVEKADRLISELQRSTE